MSTLETWLEFRKSLESTKKKLLKKPNYAQCISQLNSISQKLQDEEIPEHAAVCHAELASIYEKSGHKNEQRVELIKSARLLYDAFKFYQSTKSRIQNQWTSDISARYGKAIKIAMDMKVLKVAGQMSLEASVVMLDCECYHMTIEHGQRAIRLLEGNLYSHRHATYIVAEAYLALGGWDSLLGCFEDLWLVLMKSRNQCKLAIDTLKDSEVITVLLLRISKISPSTRHKGLLELFGQTAKYQRTEDITSKSPKKSKDVTTLSEEEVELFTELLDAMNLMDYDTVSSILPEPKITSRPMQIRNVKRGYLNFDDDVKDSESLYDNEKSEDCGGEKEARKRLSFMSNLAVDICKKMMA